MMLVRSGTDFRRDGPLSNSNGPAFSPHFNTFLTQFGNPGESSQNLTEGANENVSSAKDHEPFHQHHRNLSTPRETTSRDTLFGARSSRRRIPFTAAAKTPRDAPCRNSYLSTLQSKSRNTKRLLLNRSNVCETYSNKLVNRIKSTRNRIPKNNRLGLSTKSSTFQVEGSAYTIDFGRVSTIPPIYERSTASNISFEEGGEFTVSAKCRPLLKESPASHGVRSRPVDSGVVFGEAPLLSPMTEKELLKEAWPTDLFTNSKILTATAAEEDNSVFSVWEENYQDLSGWCMDPFQGRCVFPIGEFEENRHSGTKNEDYGVSIKKGEMIAKEPRGFLVGKESLERSTLKVMELPFVMDPQLNISSQEDSLLPLIKAEIAETKTIDLDDVLLDPTESSIALRTEDWIQLGNVKKTNDSKTFSIQLESGDNKNSNIVNAEYLSPIPLELAKNEKDNWDVINTGADAFDLLSYLCDDNIQSPESSISRDSEPALKSNTSSVVSPVAVSPTTRQLRNTRRAEDVSRDYTEASTSSASSIAAISAALESVSKMSRRSSRAKKRANSRTRKDSERSGQERGKKRCVDSESEDRMSDCSYRESREKNNEASRKSRMNKKAKENEMMARAGELERDNRILKMKVEELEKLVTSMRSTILRSALKRSS